jgi:hypothetical protein
MSWSRIAFGLVLAATPALRAFDIVVDSTPATAVIVPDNALPAVTYAADELRHHIRKAAGCDLDVYPESEIPNAFPGLIYLGATKRAQKAEIDTASLPPNGCVIRTVGTDLVLAGRDSDGPPVGGYRNSTMTGTLFAVYELLETRLGVRWLWPGELGEVVPRTATIRVPDTDILQPPRVPVSCLRVSGRTSMLGWGSQPARDAFLHDQDMWMKRQRICQLEFISCAHSFTTWWESYGKEHPEWFHLLPDGTRRPLDGDDSGKNITMCVSNPGLQNEIVERWAAKGGPQNRTVIRLGENDTPGMCTCEACRAWDAPQPGFAINPYWSGKRIPSGSERFDVLFLPDRQTAPSLADRYARFYLEVQKRARLLDPNARVAGFAYANYERPPLQTRLNANVIITLVPALYWPWTDAKRDAFRTQWQGWRDAGASLFLRPNYTLSGHNMPIFYARKLAADFSFAWRNGLIGTDFDSLLGAWSTQGPNLYALGRLHARPDLSPEQILDEYYSGFGTAKERVAAYFTHWERLSDRISDAEFDRMCQEEGGGSFKDWLLVADRIFTPAVMEQGRRLLDAAADAAAAEPVAARRIDFLQTGLHEASLTLEALKAFKSYGRQPNDITFDQYRNALRTLETYRHDHERSGFANLYYSAFRENRLWDRSLVLVQDNTIPLPRTWKFMWDPHETGIQNQWYAPDFNDSEWLDIGTDSAWEKQPVGKDWKAQHGDDFNGVAWYRTQVSITPDMAAKRLAILFGAVDEACTVWINGRKVLSRVFDAAKNPNSWAEAFEVPVSGLLRADAPNAIAVRVEDRAGAGGIWKPVWLSVTGAMDPTRNLLLNPGFEKETRHGKDWTFLTYKNQDGKTYTAERDLQTAHTGQASMRIDAAKEADGRLVQKIPDLDPQKLYRLTTRLRTAPGFQGKLGINIGARAACGDTNGAWREIVLPNIPAPDGRLYLGFWVSKCVGTVWLDDIELTPMPEPDE